MVSCSPVKTRTGALTLGRGWLHGWVRSRSWWTMSMASSRSVRLANLLSISLATAALRRTVPWSGGARALLVTWGSTGDVLPYVGLGSGLRAAGVEVTAVTSERLAPFFRRHGMTVRELPWARHEESALAADRFERGQSLRRLRSRKRNAQDMARVIARGVLDAASQGTDVLLAHPLAHPLCAAVAQASGTRSSCTPAPHRCTSASGASLRETPSTSAR